MLEDPATYATDWQTLVRDHGYSPSKHSHSVVFRNSPHGNTCPSFSCGREEQQTERSP